MMGLSADLDCIVKPHRTKQWIKVKNKWFCEHDKCKIPGLLKIGFLIT